jgi:carboxyl-terminal processing protease
MFQKLKTLLANLFMIFGFLFITTLIGMVIMVHKIAEETGLDQAFLPLIKAAYLLKEHYVEPLNPKQTKERIIGGFLNNLDPHTMYLTPEDVKSFKEDMHGAYGGIGIGARPSDDKKTLVIKDVQDKGPASLLGLQSGDKILSIDGDPIEKHTMQENFKKIRGPIGSQVELEVLSNTSETKKKIKIERKAIELPPLSLLPAAPQSDCSRHQGGGDRRACGCPVRQVGRFF